MVVHLPWRACGNRKESQRSSAGPGASATQFSQGSVPCLGEHLNYETTVQRPWHFIANRATSALKQGLLSAGGNEILSQRAVRRPALRFSAVFLQHPLFPSVPTTRTLVHARPVSCLDPCRLCCRTFSLCLLTPLWCQKARGAPSPFSWEGRLGFCPASPLCLKE